MLRTTITLLEIFIGLGGLLCVNYVRRRFGDAAAGATGATSVLLLAHSVARTIGDSRFAQAWQMLFAAATAVLVFSWLFPDAADFFGDRVQWGTPVLIALGCMYWPQNRFFAWIFWAMIPILFGQELMTKVPSSNLVQAAKSVTSIIPPFDSAGAASPPAYCGPAQAASGLCPPGSAPAPVFCGHGFKGVNGRCVPKDAPPPAQPAAVPTAPAPVATPSPGIAAGTITVCDKNRKEVLTDYQLIAGGITLNLFNPLQCDFTLNVKPGGTIRVTFYDNSTMEMNFQTCATPDSPGCTHRRIKSIASVTPSSIITLEVTPQAAPAAPSATPSPGIASGTVTVCDKNRKETLEDYQLIAGGITLNLFNPLRCKSSFVVKSGTIRITYRDNSHKDFTSTTCPAGTKDPGCTFTVPPVAIASVTPSSIITLAVEPVR